MVYTHLLKLMEVRMEVRMDDKLYLIHHGVKGMKWGVRKTRDISISRHPRGSTVITKGTKFQRITTNSNTGFNKGVYMSYKTKDKDLYKGVLGRMRLTSMLKESGDIVLNEVSMTARKDIVIPSKEVRLAQFKKLYEAEPEKVMALINAHQTSRYNRSASDGFDSGNQRQVSTFYEKFNDALSLGPTSPNGAAVKKYYAALQKSGYDAIADENDIRLGTFKAQAPIIMFNTKKSIGETYVKNLSSSEVFAAYNRSLPSKMIRSTVMVGNLGRENLTPETKAKSTQYARQIEKDKHILNENYTLTNLAEDWGQNRLSSRQIRKVSDLMDNGASHTEAISKTIGIGNIATNIIFKKLGI